MASVAIGACMWSGVAMTTRVDVLLLLEHLAIVAVLLQLRQVLVDEPARIVAAVLRRPAGVGFLLRLGRLRFLRAAAAALGGGRGGRRGGLEALDGRRHPRVVHVAERDEVLAHQRLRVARPHPKPMTAILTVSLGAWMPCPSTCRGTMVIAAPVPATVVTNLRLVMSPIVMPFPLHVAVSLASRRRERRQKGEPDSAVRSLIRSHSFTAAHFIPAGAGAASAGCRLVSTAAM